MDVVKQRWMKIKYNTIIWFIYELNDYSQVVVYVARKECRSVDASSASVSDEVWSWCRVMDGF